MINNQTIHLLAKPDTSLKLELGSIITTYSQRLHAMRLLLYRLVISFSDKSFIF